MVLAECFNINIPRHDKRVIKAFRNPELNHEESFMDGWRIIPWNEVREGDVLRMNGYTINNIRTQNHVGICIEKGKILHTEESTGSIIEKMHSKRFEWRPVKGYRWITH